MQRRYPFAFRRWLVSRKAGKSAQTFRELQLQHDPVAPGRRPPVLELGEFRRAQRFQVDVEAERRPDAEMLPGDRLQHVGIEPAGEIAEELAVARHLEGGSDGLSQRLDRDEELFRMGLRLAAGGHAPRGLAPQDRREIEPADRGQQLGDAAGVERRSRRRAVARRRRRGLPPRRGRAGLLMAEAGDEPGVLPFQVEARAESALVHRPVGQGIVVEQVFERRDGVLDDRRAYAFAHDRQIVVGQLEQRSPMLLHEILQHVGGDLQVLVAPMHALQLREMKDQGAPAAAAIVLRRLAQQRVEGLGAGDRGRHGIRRHRSGERLEVARPRRCLAHVSSSRACRGVRLSSRPVRDGRRKVRISLSSTRSLSLPDPLQKGSGAKFGEQRLKLCQ